jgi:cyclohexanecarboxylate-CoA ligase
MTIALSGWNTIRTPTREETAAHERAGSWRRTTFLDDLARHARERPGALAVAGHVGAAGGTSLTYAELQATVQRLAAGLVRLGVGRRDVVLLYLPNRWQLAPLYLACMRIGAVASPMIPALDARELRHVLVESGAKVCITVDDFGGADYGARLAEVAPPTLAHRVVIGDAARSGALPFESLLAGDTADATDADATDAGAADETGAAGELAGIEPAGPTEPVFLLYTSGTTGVMKGVVHCPNTLYAAARSVSVPHRLGPEDVIAVPNYMTHMAGATYAGLMPVLLGAASVVQDPSTDMGLLLDLIEAHRVTWVYGSPAYVADLIVQQRAKPRDTSSLHRIVSGSAPVQPGLIAEVREVFDVPLHTLWGMTENGAVTVTLPEDPPGWGAHSDGTPIPWMELRIEDADPDSGEGRLWVRGANQCLGYLNQRAVYEAALDADGWFDTGDIARPDGRDGIRITGRRADLINRASGQKVAALEVEAVLMRHPAVKDVCIVGYPDPAVPGGELVCAVVVPEGRPPALPELQEFLAAERMTRVRWPDRVQYVWQLPRNSIGKVLREPLRERLRLARRPRP